MFPWFAFGHFIPYLHLSNKLAENGHNKNSFLLPKAAQSRLDEISHYPNLIQFFPLVVPHVDGIPPGFDVPQPLHKLLAIAFDQIRDQVEAILRAINLDMVFYDLGHWVPALAQQIDIKSIYHALDRILTSMKDSDVIVYRTYREIEGVSVTVARHFSKPVMLTGPCLSEKIKKATQLEEKWANWLSNFEPGSVVFCAFGSQIILQKDDFQELVLGFELLPAGFQERVQGRGLVHGSSPRVVT
ncbi:hypothetical protein CRYUN_Cryun38cG0043600 [Craigia yunnanensis]